MNNQPLDKFFQYASRAVIIFPVVAIALILLLAKNPFEKKEAKIVPSPSEQLERKEQDEKIDLKASYVCSIKNENNASTSAYIKNKNLRADVYEKGVVSHIIYKEDCLYAWDSRGGEAAKKCGLSQYLSMLEGFGGMGGSGAEAIFDSFFARQTSGDLTPPSFSEVCKKKEVEDASLFEVPKNIIFEEEKAEGK